MTCLALESQQYILNERKFIDVKSRVNRLFNRDFWVYDNLVSFAL